VGRVARAIASGSFPLTVLDEQRAPCDRCPYASMCRVEPGRWRARREALERSGRDAIYLPDPPAARFDAGRDSS